MRSEKQAKGYDLEGMFHRRELELRERLGNRILRSFKEVAPQIEDVQLEKKFARFSKGNQKRILQQFPEASYLKSLAAWEKKRLQSQGRDAADWNYKASLWRVW